MLLLQGVIVSVAVSSLFPMSNNRASKKAADASVARGSEVTLSGWVVGLRPVLPAKSDSLFCASGPDVLRFSLQSGRLTGILRGHSDSITALHLDQEPDKLVTAALDGDVRVWDWGKMTEVASRKLTLGRPITHLSRGVVALSDTSSADALSSVHMIDMQTGQLSSALYGGAPVERLVGSLSGQYAAAIVGKGATTVWLYCRERKIQKEIRHIRRLTCLDISPNEKEVCAGDERGEVTSWAVLNSDPEFWKSAKSSGNRLAMSTRTWHSSAVGDVCFLQDGMTLLSGGQEAVLCLWAAPENAGKPSFLPRLGCPVKHITSDESGRFVLLSMMDNSVKVIDFHNDLKEKHTLRGVLSPFIGQNKDETPLQSHLAPAAGSGAGQVLVYGGGMMGVQLVDCAQARIAGMMAPNLQARNYIGGAWNNHMDKQWLVAHVSAFAGPSAAASGDTSTMEDVTDTPRKEENSYLFVTLARRDNPDRCMLKVYDCKKKEVLSICTNPHDKEILKVCPLGRGLVGTCSADGTAKVWGLDQSLRFAEVKAVYTWRQQKASDMHMSGCGQVVAVAFGRHVTLWVDGVERSEAQLVCEADVASVVLVPGKEHLLLALDACMRVNLFDLRSLSLTDSYSFEPLLPTPNPSAAAAVRPGLLLQDSSVVFVGGDLVAPLNVSDKGGVATVRCERGVYVVPEEMESCCLTSLPETDTSAAADTSQGLHAVILCPRGLRGGRQLLRVSLADGALFTDPKDVSHKRYTYRRWLSWRQVDVSVVRVRASSQSLAAGTPLSHALPHPPARKPKYLAMHTDEGDVRRKAEEEYKQTAGDKSTHDRPAAASRPVLASFNLVRALQLIAPPDTPSTQLPPAPQILASLVACGEKEAGGVAAFLRNTARARAARAAMDDEAATPPTAAALGAVEEDDDRSLVFSGLGVGMDFECQVDEAFLQKLSNVLK